MARMVEVGDDVRLCVDMVGDPDDPAILLIGGATSSMDWWEPDFCRGLAEAGRFVIRYDARDTGESTHWPAGEPGYSGDDLTLDALRLLDAVDVDAAHLVGVSMGGGIAQDLAVRSPGRVLSLTLVATSAAFDRRDQTPLPPPEPRIQALFEAPEEDPDWDDETAVVDMMVDVHRTYAGTLGIDEDVVREISRRVVRRTPDVRASVTNHWKVVEGDPSPHVMTDVKARTLVLHGTDDPLFPLPHGEALALEIPGARLVPVPGMGHEMPPRATWDLVVPEIVTHTADAD